MSPYENDIVNALREAEQSAEKETPKPTPETNSQPFRMNLLIFMTPKQVETLTNFMTNGLQPNTTFDLVSENKLQMVVTWEKI